MNVSSNPHALVLFDAAQPARRDIHSERNPPALRVVTVNGEPQKRVGAAAGTELVPVRVDHFSRTGAQSPTNDGSYGDPRTTRHNDRPATSSVIRQYLAQSGNDLTAHNQVALYAQIEGASTAVVKGAHIDVFA